MRFGSLFSGIGGLDLGLERAGWRCAWQVELDPWRRSVLAHHWPDVPRYADVTEVTGDQLGAVDAIVGGFPCQDVSLAGRRAGLAGARSSLFFEFARLVRELRPRWLLVENVPGLLSSNDGRDFAAILAVLGDLGYGLGWRVLDSRFFGVAQRRRRVFVVGRAGRPCPPEVLALAEGGSRNPRSSVPSGEIAAGALARSIGGVGGGQDYGANKGTLVGTLLAPKAGWNGADEAVGGQLVSHTLSRGNRLDTTVESYVIGASSDADRMRTAPGTTGRLDDYPLAFSVTPESGQGADLRASETDTANTVDATASARSTDRGTFIAYAKQHAANHGDDHETWAEADLAHTRDSFGDARDLIVSDLATCGCCPHDPLPDSPRYRGIADAVTVPVAEWIGANIIRFEEER